ncbi:MAG: hypothetical protein QW041_00335 [Candidatus Pacearchaeota archaeon]
MTEYKITVTPEEHLNLLEISEDQNFKVHKEKMIMMGAHMLALIESHPEIMKHWIFGIDASLKSFVTLEKKKEIIIDLEQIKWDNPIYKYRLKMFEEGKEEPAVKGFIYTTDIEEVFRYEAEKKKLELKNNKPKITDLEVYKKIISPYCANLHIDESLYKEKYGEKISGMIVLFKEIGKLYNYLAKDSKTYIYSGQRYESFLTSIDDESFEIIGEKSETKTFKGIEFTNLELLIKNSGGLIAKSTVIVSAF